jgi:hypothetical protein
MHTRDTVTVEISLPPEHFVKSDVDERGGKGREASTHLGCRHDLWFFHHARAGLAASITISHDSGGNLKSDESTRVAPVRGVDRSAAGAPSLPAAEHPQPRADRPNCAHIRLRQRPRAAVICQCAVQSCCDEKRKVFRNPRSVESPNQVRIARTDN